MPFEFRRPRSWLSAAIWLLLPSHGVAAQTSDQVAALTHVSEIRSLSQADAAKLARVRLRGVVTALSGWKNSFFLFDNDTGISVDRADHGRVQVGDEVEIEGTTGAGLFAPVVLATHVTKLGRGRLPSPRQVTYSDLLDGKQDSQPVEIHGIVHSAQMNESWGRRVLTLQIEAGGGIIAARIHDFAQADYAKLVDAEVRARGVCGTIFNERRQFVGVRLFVPNLESIDVLSPARQDPFAIAESGLKTLHQFGSFGSSGHRIKISGVVTYQKAGHLLYLQSGDAAIAVQSATPVSFASGSRVEAAGFTGAGEYAPTLNDALVRKVAGGIEPPALKVDAAHIIQVKDGFAVAPYDGMLVQVEGKLESTTERPGEQILLLRDGPFAFRAIIPLERGSNESIDFRLGARLRIKGICVIEADHEREPVAFHILARSPRDSSIRSAPWWTPADSFGLIALLLLLCFALLIWILHLMHALPGRDNELEKSRDFSSGIYSSFISLLAVSLTAGMALLVLVGGWAFHIPVLRHVFPGNQDMVPNTAIGLLCLCLGLFAENISKQRRVGSSMSRFLPGFVTVMSLLTIVEHLTGSNFGIDDLLHLTNGTAAASSPRMAFTSAVCLALLGYVLFFSRLRRGRLMRQYVALFVAMIGILNAVACLYGIRNFYGLAPGNGMALHTALAILALCWSALIAQPEYGVVAVLTSDEPGGLMTRRLLPAALLAPVVLGWLRWQGQLNGLYDTRFGLALFTCANIIVFAVIVWINGDVLNRLGNERTNSQRRLEESERMFRFTFEQAAVGIAHVLPDGTFLRVNERLSQIVGFDKEELLCKTFGDITHADDLAPDWAQARRLLDGNIESYSMDKRYLHKNGSIVWVRITVSLVRAADRSPCYFIAVIEDITERQAAQVALYESERRLREGQQQLSLVFDAGGIGSFVWDIKQDRVTAHNSVWRAYAATGDMSSAPAAWFRARQHPDDLPLIERAVRHMLELKQPLDVEFRIVQPNGTHRWAVTRAVPVCDAEGYVSQVNGINVDITDRKLAELQVKENEQYLRTLCDAMPQIIWRAQPDGKVDSYNEQWYRLTGLSRSDSAGDGNWLTVIHPDDARLCIDRWAASVRSGQSFEMEFRLWGHQRQEYRWYLGRALAIRNQAGEIACWLGTTTDIHDQKLAKELLEIEVQARTEDLRRALYQKEVLFKEVHHRVKNNLQVISSLLKMQGEIALEPSAQIALNESRQRVFSMALIHERLYGGHQVDALDFAEYAKVLSDELVYALSRSGGIKVHLKCSRILLDVDQAIPCGLILNELVTNALKYAYPKGHGDIFIELSESSKNLVTLSVADHGVGLPSGFDPSQSKSLGVVIIQILAHQLGGKLRIESVEGAKFSVTFPRDIKGGTRASAA